MLIPVPVPRPISSVLGKVSVGAILLLIAPAFIWLGLHNLYLVRSCTASVPALLGETYTKSPSGYRVSYVYTVNGVHFTNAETIDIPPTRRQIVVRYNPQNPADSFISPPTAVPAAVGTLIELLGVVLLIAIVRKRRSARVRRNV